MWMKIVEHEVNTEAQVAMNLPNMPLSLLKFDAGSILKFPCIRFLIWQDTNKFLFTC